MSIFRNKLGTRIAIYVIVGLFLLAGATVCQAEPVFEAEVGRALVRGEATAFGVNVIWPDAGPKDADFSLGLALVGSSHYKNQEQPNQAGIQFQMVDGFGKFDVGVGVVFLQNIDGFNSSHANFSLLLGYRFTKHLGIVVRHWSNAGTVDGNTGRDMALVTWRF